PDGQQFVFTSTRSGAPHLWMMHRSPAGDWTTPEMLPSPINSESAELTPSFGPDGSLYFSSNRPGGAGSFDLYVSHRDGTVASLGALNTEGPEFSPAVSKDGNLLVFMSIGRPDEIVGAGVTYNRGDLYASHRNGDAWGPAVHLPPP